MTGSLSRILTDPRCGRASLAISKTEAAAEHWREHYLRSMPAEEDSSVHLNVLCEILRDKMLLHRPTSQGPTFAHSVTNAGKYKVVRCPLDIGADVTELSVGGNSEGRSVVQEALFRATCQWSSFYKKYIPTPCCFPSQELYLLITISYS